VSRLRTSLRPRGSLSPLKAFGATAVPTPAKDLAFLDGLRGLAAFYVMVGHARWLLWEGHASALRHLDSYGTLERAADYALVSFRFGREAVLFFFVLSGFVIHLRYALRTARDGDRAEFDLFPYLTRRARRLYPPLLFAMVATLLFDLTGQATGLPIYGGATQYALINVNIHPRYDVATALGNLAFVMDTYVPPWGSDVPLWSLKYEWWFYVSYPLFWWVARRRFWTATGLLAALYGLSFVDGLWPLALLQQVFSKMLIWWLGALTAERAAGRFQVPWRRLAWLAALLPSLPFLRLDDRLGDLFWGLGFMGVLASAFALYEQGWALRPLARMRWLGEMSYTLYVSHFPLIVLLSGWLMSRSPTGELPRHIGWVGVGILLSLVFAWGAHFYVERPFMSRRRLTESPKACRRPEPVAEVTSS
jgi:peptidoglycan/LPS O-acetylase OafA/YrhL